MTREEAEAYLDTGAEPATMTPEEADAFLDGKPAAHDECDSCKAGGPCTGCAEHTEQAAVEHAGDLYPPKPKAPEKPRVPLGMLGKIGGAPGYAPGGPTTEEYDPDAAFRGGAQGASLNFADDIEGLGVGALQKLGGSELPFETLRRAAQQKSLGQYNAAEERSPGAYGVSSLIGGLSVPGMGSGGFIARGGAAVDDAVRAGQAVSRTAKAGAVLNKGMRAGLVGTGLSGAAGLGASDARLSEGEYGQAASDAFYSAAIGGPLSAVIGTGLAARASGVASKAAKTGKLADKATKAEQHILAHEALPARQRAENETAKLLNAQAKEAAAAERTRAAADAADDTARLKAEAAKQAKVPVRDQAGVYVGLEKGDTRAMGGPRRTAEKAQAIFDDPMTDMAPGSRGLAQLNKLSVQERAAATEGRVKRIGAEFGGKLDKLEKSGGATSRKKIDAELKAGPGGIPTLEEVEALKQVRKLVKEHGGGTVRGGFVDKDALLPSQTKQLLDDIGKSKGGRIPAFARKVLANNLDEVAKAKLTGEEFDEYKSLAKSYGRAKDLDRGSQNLLKKYSNQTDAGKRSPIAEDVIGVKPAKVPAVKPREVPEPATVEAQKLTVPEFEGGKEDLAQILADLDDLGPADAREAIKLLAMVGATEAAERLGGSYPIKIGARGSIPLISKMFPQKRGPITLEAKVQEAQSRAKKAAAQMAAKYPKLAARLQSSPKMAYAFMQMFSDDGEAKPEPKSATPGVNATMFPPGTLLSKKRAAQ